MTSQRYERVASSAQEDSPPITPSSGNIPDSPPPSFRSHASSRRSSQQTIRAEQDAERLLADAFESPSDDEEDDHVTSHNSATRTVPDSPAPNYSAGPGRVYGAGSGTMDGVFANITTRPPGTDAAEEKPPSYDETQQDPAPPYWETTILAPGGFNSDDVFVEGLLVGSLFSFVWNALISMSFQLIGFLLTYLLHTTHAAKHGSRAGLGITLIQYGLTMYNSPLTGGAVSPDPDDLNPPGPPSNPNSHDFDPKTVAAGESNAPSSANGVASLSNWIAYAMIVSGWFLLIKSTSDFVKARRQEQLVRASPERGLAIPVIATGEGDNAV